jgi:hypothetical protein
MVNQNKFFLIKILMKQKKTKKRNPNKVESFEGKGILGTIFSAITSKAAKEVAVNLPKTAATKLGEKAIEKVTENIFSPKKESVFTPQTMRLIDNISSTKIRRI